MRRSLVLAVICALLALLLPVGAAFGQQPPGPTIVYQSRMDVPAPPAQIDLVQVYVEFGPGTGVPSHTHGGQVLVMMTEGELNFGVGGKLKAYKAGESWVENAGEYGVGTNTTANTARLVATYLLPKGAPLTIVENAGATENLPPGPKTLYKSTLALSAPPPRFQLVQLLLDFAPGAATAQFPFGGQALATVLSGGLAVRMPGAADQALNPGDSLSETAGQSRTIANAGTAPARMVVTVLLPRGAELALAGSANAAALPRTSAAESEDADRLLIILAAVLILIGLGTIAKFSARH